VLKFTIATRMFLDLPRDSTLIPRMSRPVGPSCSWQPSRNMLRQAFTGKPWHHVSRSAL
jgi:hypothetical protein